MDTRVAIVDDNRSVRRALGRLLTAYSFDVRTHASAAGFLNSLEHAGAPDCLVTDLQLGDVMSGLDLLNHLAANGPHIPAIVITASDVPGLKHRCQLAGAALYLTKPVEACLLIDGIRALVGQADTPPVRA